MKSFAMMAIVAMVLGFGVAAAYNPTASIGYCGNSPVHVFVAPGSLTVGDRDLIATGAGITDGQDGCDQAYNGSTAGDGDNEIAQGGAFLPAFGASLASACVSGGVVNIGHHNAPFRLADVSGLPVRASIGSDDTSGDGVTAEPNPTFQNGQQCLTDGSITPGTDCDDYLSWDQTDVIYNDQGPISSNGPGPVENAVTDALNTIVNNLNNILNTVGGLLPQAVKDAIQTVIDLINSILDQLNPPSVGCDVPTVTGFPAGGDGNYVIFIEGVVTVSSNTGNEAIFPETGGNVCDLGGAGGSSDAACLAQDAAGGVASCTLLVAPDTAVCTGAMDPGCWGVWIEKHFSTEHPPTYGSDDQPVHETCI